MTNPAYLLYKLQEIDLQILKLEQRDRELIRTLRDDSDLVAAQEALASAQVVLKPAEAHHRELTLQAKSVLDKRENAEKRLYSGDVTNPKELQDMQNEVDALGRRHAELENQLLAALIAVEEAQAAVQAAQTALDTLQAEREAMHATLKAEGRELRAQLKALKEQRAAAVASIDEASLRVYHELKPQKNHHPISRLVEGSCSVCGIEQVATLIQAVKQGDKLVHCKNCQRILVAF